MIEISGFDVKPTAGRILVKKTMKPSRKIHLPNADAKMDNVGVVIEVGPGRPMLKGDKEVLPCTKGDTVIYLGGAQLKIDGEEHVMMDVENVVAVLVERLVEVVSQQ